MIHTVAFSEACSEPQDKLKILKNLSFMSQ